MSRHGLRHLLLAFLLLASCAGEINVAPLPSGPHEELRKTRSRNRGPAREVPALPGEKHFGRVWQLTFDGENAEAYWSSDETKLIFQSTRGDLEADQIFIMGADGSGLRMVSSGKGRCTCAYFLPGDRRILFSSTHLAGDAPPRKPPYDPRLGYVWPVFSSYEIFTADLDGGAVRRLTDSPGYDAEATVSPSGDRIVFTSSRDGDLEIYSMKLDGSDVRRLTHAPGYDGGPFFSPDGQKIVYRAPNRKDVDVRETKELLRRQLVRPTRLEIWVMDADGSNRRQITRNGAANFGPFWHPDGRRVIYSSNAHDPEGGNFELYLADVETLEVERVTHFQRRRPGARRPDDFDGFPMFTRDGKRLAFCSNRYNSEPNETNVFVAEWLD
ncbi:MAG: TolB family protein [Planctomycetota bacterium]